MDQTPIIGGLSPAESLGDLMTQLPNSSQLIINEQLIRAKFPNVDSPSHHFQFARFPK
jgi:hypothetical protein